MRYVYLIAYTYSDGSVAGAANVEYVTDRELRSNQDIERCKAAICQEKGHELVVIVNMILLRVVTEDDTAEERRQIQDLKNQISALQQDKCAIEQDKNTRIDRAAQYVRSIMAESKSGRVKGQLNHVLELLES